MKIARAGFGGGVKYMGESQSTSTSTWPKYKYRPQVWYLNSQLCYKALKCKHKDCCRFHSPESAQLQCVGQCDQKESYLSDNQMSKQNLDAC